MRGVITSLNLFHLLSSRGGNQRQPALSEARKEPGLGAPVKLGVPEEGNNVEKGGKGMGENKRQSARECERWQR